MGERILIDVLREPILTDVGALLDPDAERLLDALSADRRASFRMPGDTDTSYRRIGCLMGTQARQTFRRLRARTHIHRAPDADSMLRITPGPNCMVLARDEALHVASRSAGAGMSVVKGYDCRGAVVEPLTDYARAHNAQIHDKLRRYQTSYFQPYSPSDTLYLSGRRLELLSRPRFVGGEAHLYDMPGQRLLKLLDVPCDAKSDAIRGVRQRLANRSRLAPVGALAARTWVVSPQEIITDEQGRPRGYTMERLQGDTLQDLLERRSSQGAAMTTRDWARVAYLAVEDLWCCEMLSLYPADLWPKNFIVQPDGNVVLIDADSVQVGLQRRVAAFSPCSASPERINRYLESGRQRIPTHHGRIDLRYGGALIAFQILTGGCHPYASLTYADMLELGIAYAHFGYDKGDVGVRQRDAYQALPAPMQRAFSRTFRDRKLPSPSLLMQLIRQSYALT